MKKTMPAGRQVRTRFAPSPTGFLHIGGLRTALYSYAFAKSQEGLSAGRQGKFILRIEDTDRARYKPEWVEAIYKMLKIFGINWDEGPLVGGSFASYVQSVRMKTGLYRQYAEKLVKDGRAYYCCCPPESLDEIETRHECKTIMLRDCCRNQDPKEMEKRVRAGEKLAIRLKIPENETVSYCDFVLKKEISWETRCVDDVMLLKSDGFPTYHLAVVIDDALMKISHIIRGRDWLPSTPVHLLLFKYLGFSLPQIGHLTDILDPAGGKLSKRKGSVSCEEFLAEGYLPEAILNFIMLLGWAPKDNRELFTLKEFVANFQKGSLQIANPVFNRKKLDWFNGIYIRQKSNLELFKLLKLFKPSGMSDELVKRTIPLVKDRLIKLSDYSGLVDFLVEEPLIDPDLLVPKGKSKKETSQALSTITYNLSTISNSDWHHESLEGFVRKILSDKLPNWQAGELFMTIRIAITGKTCTPPLFESMAILGKEKTLFRIKSVSKT